MSRFQLAAIAVVIAAAIGASGSAALTLIRVHLAFPDAPHSISDTLGTFAQLAMIAFIEGVAVVAIVLPACALAGEWLLRVRNPKTVSIALSAALLLGALFGMALLKGPFAYPYNVIMGIFWAVVAAASWLILVPEPQRKIGHG